MLEKDYFSLRSTRLKGQEEWRNAGNGFSFVFPKGGTGEYVSCSVRQPLAPGDALLLNESSGGKLRVLDKQEMVFWSFSVCLEHLFPLFASNEISLLQNVANGPNGNKLYPASSALAKECHRLLEVVPPQFNLDHRSQLLRVAAAILTVEFQNAHRERLGFVRPEEHMIQVLEKLSVAEILKLSVGELAIKFGCSRRHLSRLFHQYFGFSVAALRMEMRLLKAVSLLRNPDAKIIRVAEECGFNHLGLFNTCFRRRFGTNPGSWRKMTMPPERHAGLLLGTDVACPMRTNGLCPWTATLANCNPAPLKTPETQKQALVGQGLGVSSSVKTDV